MFDDVKAEEIMTQNYKWINENDSLAKALSLFDSSTDVLLIRDKNRKYTGILTERMIIRSGLPREETKVKKLKVHAPKIKKTTSVQECARLMLENDVLHLPVFDGDSLVGVVDDISLLSSVALKRFGKKKVKDFISEDVIIVSPKDKIAGVLQSFREFHISRMPVVEDGELVGIITLHDIVTKLIKAKESGTFGFILDEKRSLLDYPVEDIMNYPVITCNINATVKEVIDKIVEYGISGVVVVDDQQKVVGIVTKRDLLEPLSQERMDITYPVIQINSKIENLDREELNRVISHFIRKYKETLGETSLYIYLRQHKETSKGERLIYARCRMFTTYGRFIAKAEGWGIYSAVKNALLNLERQINKKLSKEQGLQKDKKRKLMKYIEIESLT
ncbi:MAG: hypothetical protein DRO93_11895 [Candidatus Thorarchaeota archaeon]|nr:MAG: hypothetical protein DRO93_11895 [Candidatus Thorarchaeota archaeon]